MAQIVEEKDFLPFPLDEDRFRCPAGCGPGLKEWKKKGPGIVSQDEDAEKASSIIENGSEAIQINAARWAPVKVGKNSLSSSHSLFHGLFGCGLYRHDFFLERKKGLALLIDKVNIGVSISFLGETEAFEDIVPKA